jgi:hypothetical protein
MDPLSGIGVADPHSPVVVEENKQHGMNLVGRVLMQIRAEIRAAGSITSIPAFELKHPYHKVINTNLIKAIRVVCTRWIKGKIAVLTHTRNQVVDLPGTNCIGTEPVAAGLFRLINKLKWGHLQQYHIPLLHPNRCIHKKGKVSQKGVWSPLSLLGNHHYDNAKEPNCRQDFTIICVDNPRGPLPTSSCQADGAVWRNLSAIKVIWKAQPHYYRLLKQMIQRRGPKREPPTTRVEPFKTQPSSTFPTRKYQRQTSPSKLMESLSISNISAKGARGSFTRLFYHVMAAQSRILQTRTHQVPIGKPQNNIGPTRGLPWQEHLTKTKEYAVSLSKPKSYHLNEKPRKQSHNWHRPLSSDDVKAVGALLIRTMYQARQYNLPMSTQWLVQATSHTLRTLNLNLGPDQNEHMKTFCQRLYHCAIHSGPEQHLLHCEQRPRPPTEIIVAPISMELGAESKHIKEGTESPSAEDEEGTPSGMQTHAPLAVYVADDPASEFHILSPSANNLVVSGEGEFMSIKRAMMDLIARHYEGKEFPGGRSDPPLPYTIRAPKASQKLFRNHFYRNTCNLYAAMLLHCPAARDVLQETGDLPIAYLTRSRKVGIGIKSSNARPPPST